MLHRTVLFSMAMLAGSACGAGAQDDSTPNDGGSTNEGGGTGAGFDKGGGFETGGGGDMAVEQVDEVFGHSASTLYRLDPVTKAVTEIGQFDGCFNVIDIALDKDSNLFGTTADALYRIDKTTAVCTLISGGTFPNSLSFIPAGFLDPTQEALVGYQGATYVRIDPTTGAKTNIGSLTEPGLTSSGDIVSVKGGATYLTVTGGPCDTDCLVEINPQTGVLLKNWGQLGYNSAYGIAFWAGSVYGFTDSGQLFEVTFEQNVMSTALIAEPPGTSFWGAGSTTSAPPTPTPE